jgi:DNA-binding GntR family transcriptional regulator
MANSRPLFGQQSRADQVYQRLRDDIVNRDLEPGAMLDEHGLAARYAVSRTPIREALRRLNQDGLVMTVPRRGTFVRRPTLQDLVEVDQIRSLLEPAAARMAAGHVNADALAAIDDELAMLEANGSQDVDAFLRVDARLHELVLQLSGNALLSEVVTALYDRTRTVRPLSSGERVPASVAELRRIIAALRSGDGAAAEEAMRVHLKAAMDNRLRHGLPRSFDASGATRSLTELNIKNRNPLVQAAEPTTNRRVQKGRGR